MTQGLDLLRAAAHEGDAIDLGQIGGGHRVVGGGPAGLAVGVLTIRHQPQTAQRFIFVTSAIFKQLLSLTVYTLPQEMQFVKRIIFIRNMRVFHTLNIVYNLNPRAEAGRWRNNTKGEKSAQKGGFRKLHIDLRGDGERATVRLAGRGQL